NVVVFGDIGLANIKAQKFFYVGREITQLNWESKGVTLFTIGVDGQIDNNWSLKGSVKVGTGGNGLLVDYDWMIPGGEDWSHRSISLIELDHYVTAAIELNRTIYGNETSSIAVGAGMRYTDLKWTAYDGPNIYTEKETGRNISWEKPDREGGMRYRQKIPVGFLSLSGEHVLGDITISGGLQSGLSFGIKGIEDYYLRFSNDMTPAPTIGANVAVSYAVTPGASLYLSGSFDWIFHSRADKEGHKFEIGETFMKDASGATFQAMSVSFGLKGTF
ncbi:omptin family outer membrane protease, partial [Sinorhizobium medicae]|uniref:omptin family outer membrane protease n=1 Tax=Sinorhizobium medicae TaxID=110321 RepID=UPI00129618DE